MRSHPIPQRALPALPCAQPLWCPGFARSVSAAIGCALALTVALPPSARAQAGAAHRPPSAEKPALTASALPSPHFTEMTGKVRPVVAGLEKYRCFDTEFGWIFAGDAMQARRIAQDIRAAAAAFQRAFGVVPGRGAVVAADMGTPLPAQGLAQAGAHWLMPALDEANLNSPLTEKGIKEEIRRQMGSAATDEMIAQMMQQIRAQMQSQAGAFRPLRHELGHVWLAQEVYGQNLMSAIGAHYRPHYGGTAPGWLSEAAALLMEDEATTTQRRRQGAMLLHAEAQGDSLIPLQRFCTMEQPPMQAGMRMMPGGSGAPPFPGGGNPPPFPGGQPGREGAPFPGGGGAPFPGGQPGGAPYPGGGGPPMMMPPGAGGGIPEYVLFGIQCRSLMDFLMARTHSPRILREIVEADRRQQPIAAWLARHGAHYGLPTSLAALQTEWQRWVQREAAGAPASEDPAFGARGTAPARSMQCTQSARHAETPYALFTAGRFQEARQEYLQAVATSPHDMALRSGLIRTLLRLDDWQEALNQARKATGIAPKDPDAHGLYALALLRAGQPDRAAGEAAEALRLAPKGYWSLMAQGRMALWNGDREQASGAMHRATALNPNEPDAWLLLATSLPEAITSEALKPMDIYEGLHPRGYPHDLILTTLPANRRLFHGMLGETPFGIADPQMQHRLAEADAGRTPPVTFRLLCEQQADMVLLPATLQGRKLRLLFDTGGGMGLLLGPSAVADLHLTALGNSLVQGAGGAETSDQYRADSLALGDLMLRAVPIHAVHRDLGIADGILGVSSLSQYVVTLDFTEHMVVLARGKSAQTPTSPGRRVVQIPFHLLGGNILVPLQVEGRAIWAMVDTGASADLLLSMDLAHRIASERAPDACREMVMPGGGGVGSTVPSQRMLMFRDPVEVRLGEIHKTSPGISTPAAGAGLSTTPSSARSGEKPFANALTMVAGSAMLDRQVSPAYGFEIGAILGMHALSQATRVTFDYPHRLLTLEF
ncbi:MAG TPA: aspartyl protease family protein [Chthonomonadaceae bacterium]|nr:aspartyl protease family protein [Chthonomonadaceae bacterium]